MSETDSTSAPDQRWAQCSSCGGKQRKCDVRGHFLETGGDDYIDWRRDWFILQCRGCEYTFIQTVETNSEEYTQGYDENGEEYTHHDETISFWPSLSGRKRPDWLDGLGGGNLKISPLSSSLRELFKALEADLRLLAAIGVRTVFDVASEALGIDTGLTFSQKLDKLVEGNHINGVDRERLSTLVDAGNAAAHRGWSPTSSDLEVMVDVLEHFIERSFIAPLRQKALDERMADLREGVPTRRKALPSPSKADVETPPTE